MRIRYGFNIEIELSQATTVVTALDVEKRRRRDLLSEQPFSASPAVASGTYTDGFGNLRRRIQASPGVLAMTCEGVMEDDGAPDRQAIGAVEIPVFELPVDTLQFLLGSRYCETELLSDFAWSQFGAIEGGWAKAQAVCDFVHAHLQFGYQFARSTRTAAQAFEERVGVCRDFTHLAVAFCRALNIPARYCNGYLGDIGVPPDPAPMDFNAWFEAYVGGAWHTFDARHNMPRIGRIVVARGRDAADIPMLHSFGPHWLRRFEVITEELPQRRFAVAAE